MSLDIASQILFEDNHLLIVNKLSGQLVQADKTGDTPILEDLRVYLKLKYNKPGEAFLGVPHRIDRPTSGVVIFAKTSKALSRLSEMFKERNSIKKTYWAITCAPTDPTEGTLKNFLFRDQKKNKSFIKLNVTKDTKEAILHYKQIAKSDNYFLQEVVIETGRHHQIRAQMAHIGAYIKGDLKYGAPRSNPDQSISLHARKVSFAHPVSEKGVVEVIAPVPNDALWQYFENQAK
ncbi:MAG: RluA family pseudouridine synthase [Luteibaculaceae bacterium]